MGMAVLILIPLFVLFQRGSPQSPKQNTGFVEECLPLYCGKTQMNQNSIPNILPKYCEPVKKHNCVEGSEEEIYFPGAGGGFYSLGIIFEFSHGPNFSPGSYSSLCKSFNADNFVSNFTSPPTCNCTVNGIRYYGGYNVRATQRCQLIPYTDNEYHEISFGLLTAALSFEEHKKLNPKCWSDGDNFGECISSSKAVDAYGKKRRLIVGSFASAVVLTLLCLGVVFYFWKKKQKKDKKLTSFLNGSSHDKAQKEHLDLPLFDLHNISCATNNFASTNELGRGGFGTVYKGTLKDGQEIAVKRLSKNSRQGLNEFKNELMYINKLQHRNLVKLLGCCIETDEIMLIYEFMSNKSLDYYIFDATLSRILDWPKRYNIINGIARGLQYLHQDSRLRIIHRDLKVSNVLLDQDMNPKISDFGLARCFGGNQTKANTMKIVGTYGYMSPEYVVDGIYSLKSDVFSFGVMVLEIVSGERNRGFSHPGHQLNLLGHAWRLQQEGRSLELIAEPAKVSYNQSEILRTIQVGLLCVQRSPKDRPSMSSVILMMSGEGSLAQPKQPGFFIERELVEANVPFSQNNFRQFSPNGLSLSSLDPR